MDNQPSHYRCVVSPSIHAPSDRPVPHPSTPTMATTYTPNKYLRENEEMRSHIAQLKRDLEQEKNAVKQAHRDRVAEVKRAREEEAARYRKELESQLEKVRRDTRNEKQNIERTFQQQLQFQLQQKQKAQEEKITELQEKWDKERNDILTKMKAKVQAEAMAEASKHFEAIKKEMTITMFQLDSAKNEAEERANILAAADQEKAEELRKQAEAHHTELDKIRREAQQTDSQHREEIKNKDRQLASKNKEIIMLGEKLSRLEGERDQLQDDVQRYKQGDSFLKMTPKSPSVGIGDKSFEEVTAATITPKVYNEREKELIIKNGELSFRLKEVDKQNQMLKEAKEKLEHTVSQLKEANKPLEEKNKKLFQRCIDMQGAKQRQELRNSHLTSEIDELKGKNADLEKEVARQRKSLTHLLGESGSSRSTMSSLKTQNENLKSENKELIAKIQAGDRRYSELQLRLEQQQKLNRKLKQKSLELEKARQPASPEPTTLDTSQSFSDLATVDEESHCSILQDELEQVTFDCEEIKTNYGLLEREKLLLEKENDYLKQRLSGGEYDAQREEVKLQQLQHDRDEALNKLQQMEDELFSIVQPDGTEASSTKIKEETQKEETKQGKEMVKLETKLAETEASLVAAQEKVNEFTQREEQFLQQLQDLSGELEYSKEQHRVEVISLREQISQQELQNKTGYSQAENKMMQLQEELQQQLQENEVLLQKNREEMTAKEQQHFAEVTQLNEAMKTADNEATNTIEVLQLKITELELSTAKANEKVFNLAREKASMEVSLQQQLDQVKEELDQVKDTNKTVQEDSACELKAQNSATIDELVKEHAATVAGLEEQMVTITAELKESRLQLQQTTIMMVEKDSKVSELMDKVSHSEQQLSNVRKILHEAPTLMSQEDTETGRTINDIVSDLISEVDDGTLVNKHTQASQLHDVTAVNHDEEREHIHQLKETISNMQLQLNQSYLEKDQAKQQVDWLTQEHDQLREGYNQMEQQINQLSQERDQLKETYSQLEQQVDQISQLKEKNDQLEQQIDQMSRQNNQPKEINNQELIQTGGTGNELERVNQLSQERAHLLGRQNELEQQVEHLNQERQQLKERHDELEEQVDQLNQQYTELKQQYNELASQNNQLRKENDSLKEDLKSHNELSQQREAQFKEQLMEDSKVLVEMQQQLNHSQQSLNSSLQQTKERNSQLMASQSNYQILLHKAETKNNTLQKQNEKLQVEQVRLQKELSEISSTLKEVNRSSQMKDTELSMLRLQQKQPSQSMVLSKTQTHGESNGVLKQRLFVTLLDYNPQSFCQSGHPERELQLQAGDVVTVVGDMNADGYYHVQFNSKQGMVPTHFLEEMHIKNTTIKQRLHNQRLSSSFLNNGDMNDDSTANIHSPVSELHTQFVAPPTELRVERVLQRGLVISWTLPNITALGDSNGIKIQGYQIFIDDLLNLTVLGCYQSKALIGSINVNKAHMIAVATFALNGKLSSKCQTHYKPIHVSHDRALTNTSTTHNHQPINFPHHQNYQLMKVMHSPDNQLRLQEGDIVKVFGRLRKDGNYVAEAHGNQVLIPGYLLAPVVSGV